MHGPVYSDWSVVGEISASLSGSVRRREAENICWALAPCDDLGRTGDRGDLAGDSGEDRCCVVESVGTDWDMLSVG